MGRLFPFRNTIFAWEFLLPSFPNRRRKYNFRTRRLQKFVSQTLYRSNEINQVQVKTICGRIKNADRMNLKFNLICRFCDGKTYLIDARLKRLIKFVLLINLNIV